ncbi:MAG: hypothetical protein EOP06_08345 [Proteobacteria bacterium]|nr:MAG: hypothetical protein EOP06_08345 [Pseudomonadota bacterium]
MDNEECKGLATILHGTSLKWERKVATSTLWTMLPQERGLYMFVWCPELMFCCENRLDTSATDIEYFRWILYVGKAGVEDGKSDTLKDRYKNGYAKYVGNDPSLLWKSQPGENTKRDALLSRYLTLRPLEFWYLTLEDTYDILTLEKKLIKTLNPPLNKQHGKRLIPGKPEPA